MHPIACLLLQTKLGNLFAVGCVPLSGDEEILVVEGDKYWGSSIPIHYFDSKFA